ncbi:hypothetical protein B9Z19DRAFT_1193580 [Tuber borchii]|uniref:Ankyrin repeat-containing domain protein n=1 Tax=Tuber borchii TaxID=42251 RepID=A0A2T6ZRL8_TUBBO|nr:hypothetical protein B9Z19DRAFT_1193580 [Tuber borchii]
MGETEFYCTATRGVSVLVRLLLIGGEARMSSFGWHGETSLFTTIRYRDANVVKHLVERGADINGSIGTANAVKALLKRGTEPDVPDAAGLTALHRIVSDSGPLENPLALLGIKLNINVRNYDGQTLLLLAVGNYRRHRSGTEPTPLPDAMADVAGCTGRTSITSGMPSACLLENC